MNPESQTQRKENLDTKKNNKDTLENDIQTQELELIQFIREGNLQECKSLVEKYQKEGKALDSKSNTLIRDEYGYTVLHHAVKYNRLSIAVWLIDDVGINVNDSENVTHQAPLLTACEFAHLEIVPLLVEKGADRNVIDFKKKGCFHYCAEKGFVLGLHYFYCLNGNSIDNSGDEENKTPLHYAALGGADVNALDSEGNTPLHSAAQNDAYHVANLLVDFGNDWTLENRKGMTAKDIMRRDFYQSGMMEILTELEEHPENIRPKRLTPWIHTAVTYSPFLIPYILYWMFTRLPFLLLVLGLVGFYFLIGKFKPYLYPGRGFNSRFPAHHIVSVLNWFSLYWAWVWFYTPVFEVMSSWGINWLNYGQPFFLVFMWYIFWRVAHGDPGYLKGHKTAPRVSEQNMTTLIVDRGLSDKNFCAVCEIQRPKRARHCRQCDNCVARQDHHCPWTNACIGTLNHRLFIVLCFMWILVAIVSFMSAFLYMTCFTPDLPPFNYGLGLISQIVTIYKYDVGPLFICVTNIFHMGWVILLLGDQIRGVLENITMTESQLEHRLKYRTEGNPWSLGDALANAKQFLNLGGYGIDWFVVYEEKDYRPFDNIQWV